jgi:DNA-binding MarR family transcriptional regulator
LVPRKEKKSSTTVGGSQPRRNNVIAEPAELDHHGVGYLVRQAHRAFIRVLGDKLKEHDFTPAQWTTLRALWEEDGYSQVELAHRIRVEKASLTAVLDSLERRGFIARVRSTEDRRMWNVHLTAAGRSLEAELLPFAAEINQQAARGLDEADFAHFRRVLQRIIVNLQ